MIDFKQFPQRLIKKAFRHAGLEIHRAQVQSLTVDRTSFDGCLNQAIQNGLAPKTVIDVGAATGTPELYRAFPQAHHLLIEPLEENVPYLEQWIQDLEHAEYVLAAATAQRGEITINVHPDLVGSSIYKEDEDSDVNGYERAVPALPLDEIVLEKKLEAPYLIKIDTQGSELDVLQGATALLQKTDLIILEVSFFDFFQGGPTAFDCFQFMKERGFVIYDIFDLGYRMLDNAMAQANMAFVREDGVLRKEHYYASREQRQKLNQQLLEQEYH
ncbi:FkbM family methyltransferase [Leptolyngbya sp. FACHB-17]|uniref:FkbM family methyltransferase n=1 Tax=unclassified Leptolyngbya TaxID=2650499 RepID=UPI0016802956|nr:FkbM family methyltransferase [Leptolyngbya sp. FACHB-17]MBD2081299.1 FkbM family methyltransferase [Leptolyngbya sp. FACHB-17]